MLTLLIRSIWLAMCLLMVIAWIVQLPLGQLGLLLPYACMLLSLCIFNTAPKRFRYLHHSFVVSSIVVSLFFVTKLLIYDDQADIAAFFLIYGVGFGYLIFIALFSLFLKLQTQMSSS